MVSLSGQQHCTWIACSPYHIPPNIWVVSFTALTIGLGLSAFIDMFRRLDRIDLLPRDIESVGGEMNSQLIESTLLASSDLSTYDA
jgi:hypothetical protein